MVGLGYTGPGVKPSDPPHIWDRACNVDILGFEFALNSKDLIDAWNKKTGSWLRQCVYLRLVTPGKKPSAWVAVITYMVSAFWHGFRPGYYLTFASGALFNIAARSLRRTFRPLFLQPSLLAPLKPVYDIVGWAATLFTINFLVIPFQLWYLQYSILIWSALKYLPIVGMILIVIVLDGLGVSNLFKIYGRKNFHAIYESNTDAVKTKKHERIDSGVSETEKTKRD